MKEKWKNKKWNDVSAGKNPNNQQETNKNGVSHKNKFKKKIDLKEVQCYCSQRFRDYARDNYFNKESNASD